MRMRRGRDAGPRKNGETGGHVMLPLLAVFGQTAEEGGDHHIVHPLPVKRKQGEVQAKLRGASESHCCKNLTQGRFLWVSKMYVLLKESCQMTRNVPCKMKEIYRDTYVGKWAPQVLETCLLDASPCRRERSKQSVMPEAVPLIGGVEV